MIENTLYCTYVQNDAINHALKNKNYMAFSIELCKEGKRKYLVTDPITMWNIHKNKPEKKRNMHEVICEGLPCKLYFDLEFKKIDNESSDGNKMVIIFIKLVCWALQKKFNINCDISNVLWLTSSANEKFSAHLIFQLDNIAFKNNNELGNFVYYIYHELKTSTSVISDSSLKDFTQKPSIKELQTLFIKNNNKEESFCDLAVYTRNRNFRTYFSTKFESNRPFVLCSENKYQSKSWNSIDRNKEIFLNSLITYFTNKENLRLLTFTDEYRPIRKTKTKQNSLSINKNSSANQQSSNFPELDTFVKSLISKNGNGYIYKINLLGDEIAYSICGYRYCENIQREHKSNNIIIVVSLYKEIYYQRCYDQECRAIKFKSKERPLPANILKPMCINTERNINENYQEILDKSLSEKEELDFVKELIRIEQSLKQIKLS